MFFTYKISLLDYRLVGIQFGIYSVMRLCRWLLILCVCSKKNKSLLELVVVFMEDQLDLFLFVFLFQFALHSVPTSGFVLPSDEQKT